MRALNAVLIFTGIEVGTLVAWLVLAGLPFHLSGMSILAVAVLAAGLAGEHYVAINAGAGRPLFGPLPPDKE